MHAMHTRAILCNLLVSRFLETAHVRVLLPGLSTSFLRKLNKLTKYAYNKLKSGHVFTSNLKWQRAEKLYQFKKRYTVFLSKHKNWILEPIVN